MPHTAGQGLSWVLPAHCHRANQPSHSASSSADALSQISVFHVETHCINHSHTLKLIFVLTFEP